MNIQSVIKRYQAGKMVIICDDQSRENECDLVIAAEHATPEAINFMATYGKGLICTPVPLELAKRLNLHPMVDTNTDTHQTAFTVSIDEQSTTTGISAFERSKTIQRLIKEDVQASDFKRPGHVFPLVGVEGGLSKRRGHTEASIALSELAGLNGVSVICEIMNDDGTMARKDELDAFAKKHDLDIIDIDDILKALKPKFNRISEAKMPTEYGSFEIITYENKFTLEHHVALYHNSKKEAVPLVRVHSECLTGDAFHSLRCDCGQQLKKAQKDIIQRGHGAILYLRQEGRGIGLVNKIKAYALQDQGADTVEANHQLGFEADLRRYDVAIEMLEDLNLKTIDLLTNNPDKLKALELGGVTIHQRVQIELDTVEENRHYLETKKEKMGHWLNLGGK